MYGSYSSLIEADAATGLAVSLAAVSLETVPILCTSGPGTTGAGAFKPRGTGTSGVECMTVASLTYRECVCENGDESLALALATSVGRMSG